MTVKELVQKEIDKGVSRRELARRCNVSLGTIQNVLLGDTEIKNSTLEKISLYFKVQTDRPAIAIPSNNQATLRDILKLHEEIHKLATEIGEIKTRMLDAAQTGDLKRLGMVSGKGK